MDGANASMTHQYVAMTAPKHCSVGLARFNRSGHNRQMSERVSDLDFYLSVLAALIAKNGGVLSVSAADLPQHKFVIRHEHDEKGAMTFRVVELIDG